jgi:hypothetical protein
MPRHRYAWARSSPRRVFEAIIRVHAASASWPVQVLQVAASSDRAGVIPNSVDSSNAQIIVDRWRGMVAAP